MRDRLAYCCLFASMNPLCYLLSCPLTRAPLLSMYFEYNVTHVANIPHNNGTFILLGDKSIPVPTSISTRTISDSVTLRSSSAPGTLNLFCTLFLLPVVTTNCAHSWATAIRSRGLDTIDRSSLQRTMKHLGQSTIRAQDCEAMISEVDRQGKGCISKEDFQHLQTCTLDTL